MGNREEVIERAEKHLRQLAPHQRDREAAKLIADLLGAIFAPALSQESVRSEALKEAEKVCVELERQASDVPSGEGYDWFSLALTQAAIGIRKLQQSPARVAKGEQSSKFNAGPERKP